MDEGFLLSQIDGRTDLRTLAIITGLGVPKTYRLTLSLIDRGILDADPEKHRWPWPPREARTTLSRIGSLARVRQSKVGIGPSLDPVTN